MFLLDVLIGDPTRILLEDVKLYWKAWVSLEAKGYPFSFLSGEEEEEQEQEQEQEEEEEEEEEEETHSKVKKPPTKQLTPPQDFDCDDGIPPPTSVILLLHVPSASCGWFLNQVTVVKPFILLSGR